MTTTMAEAFRAERASQRTRRRREPVLTKLARFAGRRLPKWSVVRSFVLQAGGLAALDVAAFQWTLIAGLVASGVSLFVLDWLVGGDS